MVLLVYLTFFNVYYGKFLIHVKIPWNLFKVGLPNIVKNFDWLRVTVILIKKQCIFAFQKKYSRKLKVSISVLFFFSVKHSMQKQM